MSRNCRSSFFFRAARALATDLASDGVAGFTPWSCALPGDEREAGVVFERFPPFP